MFTLSNTGWKSGVREWLLQRFSGMYVFLYFFFILCYLTFYGGFIYSNWILLFSSFFFKIITIIFGFNIALHASIGMSIVLTDYIKNSFLRVSLDFLINVILLAYIFCIMQILWGFK